MSLILEKSNSRLMRMALVFASVLFVGLLAFSIKTVQAADPNERLIKIHDGNVDTSIVTRADSVREALNQAGIQTGVYDNVDPSLDTELTDTTYQVNIYRAQPVMVVDGLKRKTAMTAYDTPEQIAKDAGMPLYDEDKTTLTRSGDVLESDGAGLILNIHRATRFTLVLYGKPVATGTQADDVAGMLEEKSIILGKKDTISKPLSTPITAGMRVEIWRNGKQTVTREEPVAFPVQQIQDSSQPVGYKKVKTPGVQGKKVVTYEIEMRNGKEVSRKVIQSVRILAPHAQVEIVGTKPSFSGSFAEALARLRACEAGGNYANKNNPNYRGAYQYNYSTWGNYQGYHDPADAPPSVQDQKAWETYQRRGWQPWPHCGSSLPDIYR